MTSEVSNRAAFSLIRYAQCWEDADILLAALALTPGATVVSIMSAGDNTLSLLTGDPARVIAVDLSPAQRCCAVLKSAAFRTLDHGELLELNGSRQSSRRLELYHRCRSCLTDEAQTFWDARPGQIAAGIGGGGKFERYFRLFRLYVLPLVHRRRTVQELFVPREADARRKFYEERWDTPSWRLLFRVFFSRRLMGALGRDPAFFRYVEGSVAERILTRTRYALTTLDPCANPYLHWILTGHHGDALPHALRNEHFAPIRERLDRVEWRVESLEQVLAGLPEQSVDAFNLSDIFEYMSADNYQTLLRSIVRVARPGARLAYWNMLVPRSRPDSLADVLRPRDDLAEPLFRKDHAWFYSRFVVEEVIG
jgi:S-adenosylmethionine-diacylglycerol 3-amino-3-carboxypropyl transferase